MVRVGVAVRLGVDVGVGGVWDTQRSPLWQVAPKTAVQFPHEALIGTAQLVAHWQQTVGPGKLDS
jgi:hypothetical protein